MKDFSNKIIWITGTSSGMGKEVAFRFAEAGARLILTALEPDLLEQVREECLRLGAKAVTNLPFDLSQTDALPQLAQDALSAGHFCHLNLWHLRFQADIRILKKHLLKRQTSLT